MHEAVVPFVAAHHHMGDGVDPQPRRITVTDHAIEQVDVGRRFLEQRIERIVQEFEPGEFGIAKIDHDTRLFGDLDAGFADSLFQRPRRAASGADASATLRFLPHMGVI
jgi:hypothetical protein